MNSPDERRPRSVDALLAVALTLLSACPGRGSTSPDGSVSLPGDRDGVVGAGVERLAAQGFVVDTSTLSVRYGTVESELETYGERLGQVWSAERVATLAAVARILFGDELGTAFEPEAFVSTATQSVMQGLAAYYDGVDGHEIVVVERPELQISGIEAIVDHELAHAYQDQLLGHSLWTQRIGDATTVEQLRVGQLGLEGHAQLVATAVMLARTGGSLDELSADDVNAGVGRLLSGELASIYERGAMAAIDAYHRGGWTAVEALFLAPPSSSEQLLHADKFGTDEPTVIEAPTIPDARLIAVDTFGALSILLIARSLGFPDHIAELIPTGWDGDCLAIYEHPRGHVIVWRTLWDRPEDAAEFEAFAVTEQSSASAVVVRDRHTFDIVVGPSPEDLDLAEAIASMLPPLPTPPASDAETSAAIQTRILAEHERAVAVVRDGRLYFGRAGLSLPIPEGWSARSNKGIEGVVKEHPGGGASTVTVTVGRRLKTTTLAALETELRDAAARMDDFELVEMTHGELAGEPALVWQKQGIYPGTERRIRQLGYATLRGDQVIVIVGGCPIELWDAEHETLRAIMVDTRWTPAP